MSTKKSETRARVKAMREEQARADRRKERLMRFGLIGAVILAVAIVVAAVTLSGGGDSEEVEALPQGVTEEAGGVTADPAGADAPVTMDIYLDFLCPHCATFEQSNGQAVQEIAASGQANVVYHPVTFTGQNVSARATNAWGCAIDQDMGQEFMQAAFANQQQWNANSLKELGASLDGLDTGAYNSCVDDSPYEGWATATNTAAQEAGIDGTPTVLVNGEELGPDSWTPEGLQQAVAAATEGGNGDATGAEPEPTGTQ